MLPVLTTVSLLAALVALELRVWSDRHGETQLLEVDAVLLRQRLPNAGHGGLPRTVRLPSDVVSLPAGQVRDDAREAPSDVLEGVDVIVVQEHAPPLLLVELLLHLLLPVHLLLQRDAGIRQAGLHLAPPRRGSRSHRLAARAGPAHGQNRHGAAQEQQREGRTFHLRRRSPAWRLQRWRPGRKEPHGTPQATRRHPGAHRERGQAVHHRQAGEREQGVGDNPSVITGS
mmetsp:Transcript_12772/g.28964  ORF Transcript_12772/g.28964 Transcript_12772/m.28964 type:complete len:229 (+) Transcript_12772:140-826(+)